MKHFASCVFLACSVVACSPYGQLQTQPDDQNDGRTDGVVDGLPTGADTGTKYTPGGAPLPNTQTDSTGQRCLLLFGGSDRVKASDVGFPFNNAARTMQAWVRTDWDGDQVAVSYGRGSLRQGYTLGIVKGSFYVDANGTQRVSSSAGYDDDEWHHVAAVFDGSNAALLIDGELDGFGALDVQTASGGFNVGNLPEASPEHHPWVGWIDDVRVFGIARDPKDVATDFDGESESSADLLAWFDFEVVGDVEGQGVAITDLSGNGHDGETAGIDDHPKFPFCR